MTATRRAVAALSAAVFVALAVLAGCADTPTAQDGPAGPSAPPPAVSVVEAQQAPVADPLEGYAVDLPAVGARSDLTLLGLNADRTIQVPPLTDVGQMGLYRHGPRPGQPGPAVILGHVNGNGEPGVFARLDEAEVGDPVDVTTPDGPRRFTVTRVDTLPKGQFPTAQVYSDTAGPELRLITCGGTYDPATRHYGANLIVYATLDA